jgi:hypothetical protein
MMVLTQSWAISKNDLAAIERMIAKQSICRQTQARRIRIWPTLGQPECRDIQIQKKRRFRSGEIETYDILATVSLAHVIKPR